jgi:3-phenylpropionate/cinnamic acid dioxygenase small subunit
MTAPTPTARPRYADPLTTVELTTFLAYEAELLDDRRYHEWVDVVSDAFTYQVPTPRTPDTPFKPHWDDRTLLIDESKWSLVTQWFRRFDKDIYEVAWGENPPVRFRHLVTNVRAELTDAADVWTVRSNVALIATRQSDPPRYLSGQRTDQIVRRGGVLLLDARRVVLDQVLLDFPQLRILL